MKRVTGLLILAAIVALQGIAVAAPFSTVSALRTLAAHGLIDGYVPGQPLSPPQAAILTARAISNAEAGGGSKTDLAALQSLIDTYQVELDSLGVRDTNIAAARAALTARTQRATAEFAPSRAIEDSASLPQANDVPAAIGGIVTFKPAAGAFTGALAGIRFNVFEVAGARSPRVGALAFSATPATHGALSTLEPGDYRDKVALILQGARETYVRFGTHNGMQPDAEVLAVTGLSYTRLFGSAAQLVTLHARAGANGLVAANIFGLGAASRPGSATVRTASTGLFAGTFGSAAVSESDARGSVSAPLVAGITFHVHAVGAAVQDVTNANSLASSTVGPAPQFATGSQTGFTIGTPPAVPQFAAANATPAYNGSGFNPFDDSRASFTAGLSPANRSFDVALSVPLRIGGAVLQNTFGAAHAQEFSPPAFGAAAPCTGATTASCPFFASVPATEDRLSAGTSFDVRALGRPIAVNLSASLAHLSREDQTAFVVPPDASLQSQTLAALSGSGGLSPTTFNPNYVDITRRTLVAGAAVPLSRDFSLNLQYNAQYYTGSYSTLGQNINSRKDLYLGNLTYTIPRTTSAITFSAKQYRYRDAFVPTYNQMQNRADLNFTVKF